MKLGVYTVKDDLSGSYQYFGFFNNHSLAKRAFSTAVSGDGIPAGDLSLYCSGYLDTDTGLLICDDLESGLAMPAFLCRGVKNE